MCTSPSTQCENIEGRIGSHLALVGLPNEGTTMRRVLVTSFGS